MTDRPYEVWIERDGDIPSCRAFDFFEAAEKFARGYVARHDSAKLEITRRFATVANVRADALGRVWTDILDAGLPI